MWSSALATELDRCRTAETQHSQRPVPLVLAAAALRPAFRAQLEALQVLGERGRLAMSPTAAAPAWARVVPAVQLRTQA
jgi:hypothetical protein